MMTEKDVRWWRARWVEALRSGEYKQCRGALHKPGDGFCCLGVLCDLAREEVKAHWRPFSSDGIADFVMRGNEAKGEPAIPPSEVRALVGLRKEDGEWWLGDCDTLTSCNDRGKTFAEIADIIESKPEGMFLDD